MTLNDFVKKYDGKTKGYPDDTQYLGECLSLAKLYIKEVFGIDPPPSGSNSAYGYWSNFPNPLGSVFIKIPNTKGVVPVPGDILIWSTNTGGGYGHIAICLSASASSAYFESFDQNWGSRAAHKVNHNYNNVVGWLHPKENMADTVAVERAKFEELVTKATKYDDIVKSGVTMASDIDNLKRQIKEANNQANTAQEEAKNSRAMLTDYQQQVADKLNSPQDIARVLSAIQGLMDSEAQALKNSEKDAFKLKEAESVILDLKSEIARLQLELKSKNSISTATMLEMFTELFNRFKRILNGL